jgi:hypothetical protein
MKKLEEIMNMHELAIEACKQEGGSNEVNIAQMKQVINVIDFITNGAITEWCQNNNYNVTIWHQVNTTTAK